MGIGRAPSIGAIDRDTDMTSVKNISISALKDVMCVTLKHYSCHHCIDLCTYLSTDFGLRALQRMTQVFKCHLQGMYNVTYHSNDNSTLI